MKKQPCYLNIKCSPEIKEFVRQRADELAVPEGTIARWALEKYRREHNNTSPFLPTHPTDGTNTTDQDS